MEGWACGLRGTIKAVLFRRHRFCWIRQLGPSNDRLDTQLDLLHIVPREYVAAPHVEPWVHIVHCNFHHVGEIIEDAPHIGLGRHVVFNFGLHPCRKLPIQKDSFTAANKQVVAVAPLPARCSHLSFWIFGPRLIRAPLSLKVETGLYHLNLVLVETIHLAGLNRLVHRRPPKRDRVRRPVVILLVQRANFQSFKAARGICGVRALTVIVIHCSL